jgi:hypothetical protein
MLTIYRFAVGLLAAGFGSHDVILTSSLLVEFIIAVDIIVYLTCVESPTNIVDRIHVE